MKIIIQLPENNIQMKICFGNLFQKKQMEKGV